jgi:hypothetical protein
MIGSCAAWNVVWYGRASVAQAEAEVAEEASGLCCLCRLM